jgi:hypothetical protein
VDKQKEELAAATTKLGQMEADWRSKRATLVDQRRAELAQKQGDASKAIEQIAQQIATEPQGDVVLTNVRTIMESNGYGNSRFQVQRKDAIQADIARASLSDQLKADLSKYVDNWYAEKEAQEELAALTENSARASVQPDWQETQNSVDQLTQSISAREQELTELKAQAQYHPEEFLKYACLGLIEFLGLVWFWGVIYESIGLAVHLAGDVKRLRQAVEVQESLSERLPAAVLTGD